MAGYKTVSEGKGRSRGWRDLVGCVSYFGIPVEAGSEAWSLEQREGKVREPLRHVWDWTWRQKRRLGQGTDLSTRELEFLPTQLTSSQLGKMLPLQEHQGAQQGAKECSKNLLFRAWCSQIAEGCHCHNRSLSTPWKKTVSTAVQFTLANGHKNSMPELNHMRLLNVLCCCCF